MNQPWNEPWPLRCGVELPNRLALAPLTNLQSNLDGTLADDELRWLVRRAAGGFGLVSTCAAYVSEEGKAWHGQLGVSDDSHLEGLAKLADAVHQHQTCAVVQLHHGGAKATLAPDLRLGTVDGDGVRGATPSDLTRVIEDFVKAAMRAKVAGFDGVELHGANGYLFTQFLAPADNARRDAFGEALQGRALLLRRTMRAVREEVGAAFLVGVRLSPVDTWARRGLVLRDSIHVARWLVADGADYIHLSLRDAAGPPPFEDTAQPVARAFRDALSDEVPVLAAGGIWNQADLQTAIDAGVDVAVVGRAAIGNPDWGRDVGGDDYEPLRPPWSLEHLEQADVGEDFRKYLSGMRGLVEDASPGT